MGDWQIIITTAGNITSDILGTEFRLSSKGIFVFVDEAAFLTEPQIAVLILKLLNLFFLF